MRFIQIAMIALLLCACAVPQAEQVASNPSEPSEPPAPPPPPIKLEPETLKGLGQITLTKRLREPDYQRQENQIQIWQYRLTSCVVDFVIIQNKVINWKARSRQQNKDYNHSACVDELTERALN